MVARVYVNGRGVDVPDGATALDAVRALDAQLAVGIESGSRSITDSRGLPASADSAVFGGAIYRIVSNRSRGGEGTGR